MKIIVIGDIHGRDTWKKIISSKDNYDKVVFLGDYLDTHEEVSGVEQLQNFKDIVEFKRNNMDKVILLIGNHDFHYMRGVNQKYSGYQNGYQYVFQEYLEEVKDLLQVCHIHIEGEKKYLFSHAGFTETWCKNAKIDMENLESSVNELFKTRYSEFVFLPGENHSSHGDDITQGPLWVRPISLTNNDIGGYTQIVGHTAMGKVVNAYGLFFCDVLPKKFLWLVDGNETIVSI